jgi:hypothetical protein
LKLKRDKVLSSFAFKFNLRHYILGLTIGGNVGGNNGFAGYIDDVRFWSAALTQATISAWMDWEIVFATSGWHPNYASLVVHYTFDEGAGRAVQVDSIKTRVESAYGCNDWN